MSLSIIVGRSNSGKSKYIYKSMLTDVSLGKHALLFVPPMSRVVAEKEYMDYLKVESITGVTITTIDRYMKNNLNNISAYNNKKYLPDMARKMYITNLMQKYEGEFSIFAKSKDSKAFIDLMYTYFDIFEKENISREEIEKKYAIDDFTKSKLLEIFNIYEKINDDRKSKFVDSLDETHIYIDWLLSSNRGEYIYKKVYFDSYNNFSKNEYAYIQALLKLGVEVAVTINITNLDDENISGGIFTESYNTYNKLKDLANNVGAKCTEKYMNQNFSDMKPDIEYLSKNIFDPNKIAYTGEVRNVDMLLVANQYEEIKYIAENITNIVKEGGARYKDFVVFTHDIEAYYLCIKRIFSKYKIPVFCNRKENISNSKIAIYIILLLDISINGFEYRNNSKLISLLKTGFFDIKEEEIDLFENYLYDLDIKGYMIEKEFKRNVNKNEGYQYNLDEINATRKRVIDTIKSFTMQISSAKTSEQITKIIYDHLMQNNIIDTFQNEINIIGTENIEIREKQKQILGRLYEIMDNICLVTENVPIEEYFKLLKYGLEEEGVFSIPAVIDQVEVCDINKTRNIMVKYGYIIGMNENSIPSGNTQDATFTEIELEHIKNAGLNIKKTGIDKMNMELFNVYLAINKCREHITFLVPSSKMTGEALRISSIIREIQDLLKIKVCSISGETDSGLKEKLFNSTINTIKSINNISPEQFKPAFTEYFYLNMDDKYKKIFSYERRADELNKYITDKLYGKEVNLSVSRLEALKRCPFAYYSKYTLSLRDKKEYKLSRLDMGSIMHEILEKVSRQLVVKKLKWPDICQNEKNKIIVKNMIDEIIDNIFTQEYSKHEGNIRIEVLKINLKKSMIRILLSISESMINSNFEPIGYEVAFDENALFAPIEVRLDDGRTIYLKGKIDRIDIAKINGANYFRVIDYKSSNKSLSLADIKEGLSLQLMTYMSAIIDNKSKIVNESKAIPAALNYFTLNTSLINLTEYEKDEAVLKKKIIQAVKLKGIYLKNVEILKNMDCNVEAPDRSFVDVNVSKMNNDDKYLLEEVFMNECENIKETLKKISLEIVNGNVKILPHDIKNCEYCEYKSICRRKNCV